MLSMFEPEELIGRYWHRWISGVTSSYPSHPQARVCLEDIQTTLGVFFRASGGPQGIELGAISARSSAHRLGLWQRLGFSEETLDTARRDEQDLLLPPAIDLFDKTSLNRDLYFWLAAFLATGKPCPATADPLKRDIYALREARRATREVLRLFPGLVQRYEKLSGALLAIRPVRRLPRVEAAVEAVIRALLGDALPANDNAERLMALVQDSDVSLDAVSAPRDYREPLPVPLWAYVTESEAGHESSDDEEDDSEPEQSAGEAQSTTGGKRKAQRRRQEESERDDPLVFNRFEKMLSLSEMVNLNRMVDDEPDENAKMAADQLDEITLSPHQQRASSQLKMDLDLAGAEVSGEPLQGEHTYPEWNFRKQIYLEDHCRVLTGIQGEEGEGWHPDALTRQRIRRVRREFEALRPRRVLLRGQLDGSELDMDAAIRAHCDLTATGESNDRLYLAARREARDLSVAILIDVSLSTDAWLEDRRVIDVEKEALQVLSHGLAGCGDDYAIYCFTSHRRKRVWVDTVKTFEERMSDRVSRRIAALQPGRYTRMGPAVRHLTQEMKDCLSQHKLILVLTDGKPNDSDYYEGRYAVEDTRRAILDARQQEVQVFGVTIDRDAGQYIPHLFGRGGYAMVQRPEHLATALPAIYRKIVTR